MNFNELSIAKEIKEQCYPLYLKANIEKYSAPKIALFWELFRIYFISEERLIKQMRLTWWYENLKKENSNHPTISFLKENNYKSKIEIETLSINIEESNLKFQNIKPIYCYLILNNPDKFLRIIPINLLNKYKIKKDYIGNSEFISSFKNFIEHEKWLSKTDDKLFNIFIQKMKKQEKDWFKKKLNFNLNVIDYIKLL